MPASVEYRDSADGISVSQLTGFFAGWRNAPSGEAHLRMLQGSSHVELALSENRVIGFITAHSDGVLSAYVSLLEVLPDWQGRGIGSELMRRMLANFDDLYMVDLVCDQEMAGFYERFGLRRAQAMVRRNYDVLVKRSDAP